METKFSKLKRLFKESTDKHEQVLTYHYDMLMKSVGSNTSDEMFDSSLRTFMNQRIKYINKFINKKRSRIVEEEIYCLSLLSQNFLDGKLKLAIVENKLILNE